MHAVCQVAIGALGKGTQTKEMTGEAPAGRGSWGEGGGRLLGKRDSWMGFLGCGDGAAVDVEAGMASMGRGRLSREGRMKEGDTGRQGWGRGLKKAQSPVVERCRRSGGPGWGNPGKFQRQDKGNDLEQMRWWQSHSV